MSRSKSLITEFKDAAKILNVLADGGEWLMTFSRRLQAIPEVTESSHLFSLRNYQLSGRAIQVAADARILDDKLIVWSIHIYWSESDWRIEYEVVIDDDERYEVLRSYPDIRGNTVDGFVSGFERALSDLGETLDMPIMSLLKS